MTALSLSDSLYEDEIKDLLSKRILVLNKEIDADILEDYVVRILEWNREDLNLPEENRVPITIYMNTVGGDMFPAFSLIDVIERSKTPVRAISFGLVASAGLHIYIACHERYSFKNSTFLMHDGSIEISGTSSKAKDTMKFMNIMDEHIKQHVLSSTKITDEFYTEHYDQEYYMYSDEAKELGIVQYIIGDDVSLDEIF